MQKFSAHVANWYSVMESAANVDLDDSEPGPWPNLRTMLQYKGETENSLFEVFLLALCPQNLKSVSAFSNSPSNLRKHVKVSKNGILLSCPSRVIMLHGF